MVGTAGTSTTRAEAGPWSRLALAAAVWTALYLTHRADLAVGRPWPRRALPRLAPRRCGRVLLLRRAQDPVAALGDDLRHHRRPVLLQRGAGPADAQRQARRPGQRAGRDPRHRHALLLVQRGSPLHRLRRVRHPPRRHLLLPDRGPGHQRGRADPAVRDVRLEGGGALRHLRTDDRDRDRSGDGPAAPRALRRGVRLAQAVPGHRRRLRRARPGRIGSLRAATRSARSCRRSGPTCSSASRWGRASTAMSRRTRLPATWARMPPWWSVPAGGARRGAPLLERRRDGAGPPGAGREGRGPWHRARLS